VAALYAAYRRDLDAAAARVALGSQLAQTPCGVIEYSSFGAGPALLLVHGGGGGIDQTREYAERLAAAGLRVVTVSRFGYLRTPLPADGSPAAQADAHACLLDSLKIERAAVLGVSAGAPSTLQFALRHARRASGVVLLVPAAYAPRPDGATPVPAGARWLIRAAAFSDFGLWLAARAVQLWARGESEQQRFARLIEQPLPLALREAGMRNDFAVLSGLQRYELERIAAPTLVVSVANDHPMVNAGARYSAAHIPGAKHLELPDGGHFWIGRNEQLIGEVAAFIRSADSAAASGRPAAARN